MDMVVTASDFRSESQLFASSFVPVSLVVHPIVSVSGCMYAEILGYRKVVD